MKSAVNHINNELTKLASTVVIRLLASSLLQKEGGGGGKREVCERTAKCFISISNTCRD